MTGSNRRMPAVRVFVCVSVEVCVCVLKGWKTSVWTTKYVKIVIQTSEVSYRWSWWSHLASTLFWSWEFFKGFTSRFECHVTSSLCSHKLRTSMEWSDPTNLHLCSSKQYWRWIALIHIDSCDLTLQVQAALVISVSLSSGSIRKQLVRGPIPCEWARMHPYSLPLMIEKCYVLGLDLMVYSLTMAVV
jgi:hypothetical protein